MAVVEERLSALGLTIIRVLVGWLWISQLFWKLPPEFGCGSKGFTPGAGRDPNRLNEATGLGGLCDWMTREANNTNSVIGFGWFPGLVQNVIIPNFGFFAWLTVFTEAFLGVALALGLFTRLVGLLGTLWSINLFVGLIGLPNEWAWTYGMIIMLNAVFFVLGARLQYSVDGLLQDRYNRWAQKKGLLGWLGRIFTPSPKPRNLTSV